jgi:hypothetical protein
MTHPPRACVAEPSVSRLSWLGARLVSQVGRGCGTRPGEPGKIRRVITESRDRHTMAATFWALDPLAALLWEYDASTAYLIRLANRRMWATGTPLPALDALDAATVAGLEERAKAMGADETVVLALEALERYLADIDPR